MKKTLRRVLAVILTLTVLSGMAVCFAATETDDATFNMYLVSIGNDKICRGESAKLEAVYDYGKYENISLVWTVEGDACTVKYLTDKSSGLVTCVKITSADEGDITVKVDMVSENGEIIQTAEKTVESVSLKERIEYEKSSSAFGFMFVFYLVLNFILVPFSGIFNMVK